MMVIAVIGKCFGDEGKGLATDYFSMKPGSKLVVRHNGGSQSGHTVECKGSGKRFVFHALSSGSVRGADTLWTKGFYPDLYKLGEETSSFSGQFGDVPKIFAEKEVCITTPDDVLINMALEASRGDRRHGSCGMGINECDLRTMAGYGIRLCDLSRMNAEDLFADLTRIRRDWVRKRLLELRNELTDEAETYIELLSDGNVLRNAAEHMIANMRFVSVLSEQALRERLDRTDTLIFESGQGLLLDRNNKEYAPHVTASDTGLKNPSAFAGRTGFEIDEAVYVSRSYVTRHGAGLLPYECSKAKIGDLVPDLTNEPNLWQGAIRCARHGSTDDFVSAIEDDLSAYGGSVRKVSLFLTHLNETDHCVALRERNMPVKEFMTLSQMRNVFDTFYCSDTKFADDVRAYGR